MSMLEFARALTISGNKGSNIHEAKHLLNFDNYAVLNPKNCVDWKYSLFASRNRLRFEIGRLSARSSSNLKWGIVISIVGAIYLVSIIFFPNFGFVNSNFGDSFFDLLPRLSLFLFFQFLAIFFLRLFANNERKISEITDEITNLELKISAGMMLEKNNCDVSELANKFANEDRRGRSNEKMEKGSEKLMHKAVETVIRKLSGEK